MSPSKIVFVRGSFFAGGLPLVDGFRVGFGFFEGLGNEVSLSSPSDSGSAFRFLGDLGLWFWGLRYGVADIYIIS